MAEPIRILLQTTITPTEDDWHIGRFSILRDFLSSLDGVEVTARDRGAAPGETDPILGAIDESNFDQLWLFAVDVGDGLNSDECAAISRFRRNGRGLMVTRDHMDLGSSVCTLGGVGAAHYFHTKNLDPDETRHAIDDPYTTYISWPNYHSGANGDAQVVEVVGEPHPLLRRNGQVITRLPAHPHEGAVDAPSDDPSARVIATGCSKVTGRPFNIAVAFEASEAGGRAVAQSTFHHFADYNLDPDMGCPSFVSEPPGGSLKRDEAAMADVRAYHSNLAYWLAGRLAP
ncbi:hypothetical protein [Phenylobacterium deserti]|uniref:ThuA-like domain-containing protein n=1 Tax=Phenylobacterium deserti TaxID=1914756 RepID=A0A328ACJ7_9CAUL|nr:hypothetical protein [Phenylobacterium deserti]RAK52325.1 hypothetical protein DJ018_14420 [Phenylobacterium deserti]